jgi:hypothetical protein
MAYKLNFQPTNLSWTREQVIDNLILDIEMLQAFEFEGDSTDEDGYLYKVPEDYKHLKKDLPYPNLFSDEFLQEYVNYWVGDWEEYFGENSEDLYDSLAVEQAFWVANKLGFPKTKIK